MCVCVFLFVYVTVGHIIYYTSIDSIEQCYVKMNETFHCSFSCITITFSFSKKKLNHPSTSPLH